MKVTDKQIEEMKNAIKIIGCYNRYGVHPIQHTTDLQNRYAMYLILHWDYTAKDAIKAAFKRTDDYEYLEAYHGIIAGGKPKSRPMTLSEFEVCEKYDMLREIRSMIDWTLEKYILKDVVKDEQKNS